MKQSSKIHKLYFEAFGAFVTKAKELKTTLKALAQADNYSGKVLRRGTPGAFGFVPKPPKSAKTDRVGYLCGGNSRQRRFMRRHPQHFSPAGN